MRGDAGWLLKELGGRFTLLRFGDVLPEPLAALPVPVDVLRVLPQGSTDRPGPVLVDATGKLSAELRPAPNACLLFRPDQHLAAVWHDFDPARVASAVMTSIGR